MKAVFLDRDGVINENRPDHVKTWEEFLFLPGVPEAIARLSTAGVLVFVVSNQAVINRGITSQEAIDAINRRMVQEIELKGGRIEEVAYCPHRPEEHCTCRKPQPGLLLSLACRHRLDANDVVVIGDALTDIEAGLSAGYETVLVLTGRGKQQLEIARTSGRNGFSVARDLPDAVEQLLSSTSDLRSASTYRRAA